MTELRRLQPRATRSSVNNRAGAVLELGGPVLCARIEAAFTAAGADAEVHLGHPGQLEQRLFELNDPATIPVIVGGDGTVLALLPRSCAGRSRSRCCPWAP